MLLVPHESATFFPWALRSLPFRSKIAFQPAVAKTMILLLLQFEVNEHRYELVIERRSIMMKQEVLKISKEDVVDEAQSGLDTVARH